MIMLGNGTKTSSFGRLRNLILEMRKAYSLGQNAMEYARLMTETSVNSTEATLIAYDLQAGTYVKSAQQDPQGNLLYCVQLAKELQPFVTAQSTLLEIGCGEATTLTGVIQALKRSPQQALGFDISWSRCAEGITYLKKHQVAAKLFVGDLFSIPLEDESIDVVYTSHSLEPNGGREEAALQELLRITKHYLILIEPIFELGSIDAQKRMRSHGYVRDLKTIVEKLGGQVQEYRLLPYSSNPLNPSGVIVVRKNTAEGKNPTTGQPTLWRCPLTATPLQNFGDSYFSATTGIAYPVLRGIPLLRPEHAVVASKLTAE
jgi:SAM-dependent methyltransferase